MKILSLLRAAIGICALALAAQASAAVLQVSSGKLTGATGVSIGGKIFDVAFVEGTCVELFSGCNEASDFILNTSLSATYAGQALISQVFIDSSAGFFASKPATIFGCSDPNTCNAFIPFASLSALQYSAVMVKNGYLGDSLGIYNDSKTSHSGTGFVFPTSTVFAKFTAASNDVPEPSSVALMSLAMAGLAFSRRRKS